MKKMFFYLFVGLTITSCNVNKQLTRSMYNVTLDKDTKESVIHTQLRSKKDTVLITNENISVGQKKRLWNNGEIVISKTDEENLSFKDFKLNIDISKEKYPSDNSYSQLINNNSKYKYLYNPDTSTYIISGKALNDISREENGNIKLVNGNWINMKITDSNNDLIYNGNFQFKKNFAWFTKISTPLLYIADGDLGEFELRKFSPSLGATIVQKNINTTSKWNYIGLNGLLDVESWEKEVDGQPNQTKYSMGAGLTLEIAGYFQFGYTYNFREENWSFVIGATPELIQKLFGIE